MHVSGCGWGIRLHRCHYVCLISSPVGGKAKAPGIPKCHTIPPVPQRFMHDQQHEHSMQSLHIRNLLSWCLLVCQLACTCFHRCPKQHLSTTFPCAASKFHACHKQPPGPGQPTCVLVAVTPLPPNHYCTTRHSPMSCSWCWSPRLSAAHPGHCAAC